MSDRMAVPDKLAIHEGFACLIVGADNELVARTDVKTFVGPDRTDQNRATARRIVALWNAAHELNLTTEAIESGVLREAVEALEAVLAGSDRFNVDGKLSKLFDACLKVRSVLSKLGNR